MMSAYSVVKAGRNEVTSRSLGCLGPPLPDPVEPRIGLPPETYEAVRQLRISELIEYFFSFLRSLTCCTLVGIST